MEATTQQTATQQEEAARKAAEYEAWFCRRVQEEESDRLTLEALAEVEAGLFVEHQAVQAWASSLGAGRPLPVPCK